MGKTRKKNRNRRDVKTSPLKHKSSNANIGIEEENDCEEDILQRIASNLRSGSSTEKECGCSSLAMVAENKVDVILERKLPRMAAPLMLDKDISVSHSAVGALVNISLTSPEVCDELVTQDVMTPLCTLLANYASTPEKHWPKKDTANGEVIDQKEEIFIEAVTLLWNLCEASETALKIFNSQNVIQLLFPYINMDFFSTDIVACILQCIYSVCENNIPAVTAIKEKGVESLFGHFFTPLSQPPDTINNHANRIEKDSASALYLQVLACGITISVLNEAARTGDCEKESGMSLQVLPILMETAAAILNQDQRKLIHDYTSLIPLSEEESDKSIHNNPQRKLNKREESMDFENGEAENDKLKENFSDFSNSKKIEFMKTEINHVLLGQQMTCEILTNLCCDTEQDGDCWEEDSDDMNSSDMSEEGYDMLDENNKNEITHSNKVPSNIPTVVLEAFISHSLVSKVLAKANFPAENTCEILRGSHGGRGKNRQKKYGGTAILKMLSTLRSRAFLCVNNMLGSDLSVEDLGGPDALFAVWSNLGLLCFHRTEGETETQSSSYGDVELVESATSAMRATTQKLFEAKCHEPFNTLCQSDIQKLIEFGATNPEANIRINLVQIIGNIGSLSTLSGVDKNLSQSSNVFAQFLLDAAAKDTDIRVVTEALDKIFDMFAEDSTDMLCARMNLVTQLKKILPNLKIKIGLVKKGKRQGVEENFLPIVNIAKTNLIRFIKYKGNRLSNSHGNE